MAVVAVTKPFHGQVIKIFEDTVTGKYTVQVDDAVGTGNTLSKLQFTDAQNPDLQAHLRKLLAGLI